MKKGILTFGFTCLVISAFAQNTLDIVQGKWYTGGSLSLMNNDSMFLYRDSLEVIMHCQSAYVDFQGNEMEAVMQYSDTCSSPRSNLYQQGKTITIKYSVSDDRGFLKLTDILRNRYGLFTIKTYSNGITLFREKIGRIK